MAHFAQLDESNMVIQVIVVHNNELVNSNNQQEEQRGIAFCQKLFGQDTVWKQTSYSASFRKHYAGVGSYYLPDLDIFTVPQPFDSWTLNSTTGDWTPPVPQPTINENQEAAWDEENQQWVVTQL